MNIRSAVMYVIACVASPCCTPLLVPLALLVLAGTPLAAWLAATVGWVYGGLTALSIVSLILGLHWSGHLKLPGRPLASAAPNAPIIPIAAIGAERKA
jgi:hypothetical protein